ncbi:MAG: metal-sensing transcriptional repressor, partial [Oscillospiraceae bacterium]|nr:metal-sensing transcriptional repressor [Oscillospiraceae bacterium]
VTAADALLRRVNKEILAAHLKHCVENAQSDQERSDKIDELVAALGKII